MAFACVGATALARFRIGSSNGEVALRTAFDKEVLIAHAFSFQFFAVQR